MIKTVLLSIAKHIHLFFLLLLTFWRWCSFRPIVMVSNVQGKIKHSDLEEYKKGRGRKSSREESRQRNFFLCRWKSTAGGKTREVYCYKWDGAVAKGGSKMRERKRRGSCFPEPSLLFVMCVFVISSLFSSYSLRRYPTHFFFYLKGAICKILLLVHSWH